MQGTLAEAVSDVVAEGGYDLILNVDSAPYFAPVLDITAKVTAKLNQTARQPTKGSRPLQTRRLANSF